LSANHNFDDELDRYADYEAQFQERQPRKRKANHKPKQSIAEQITSAAETSGLEGGFKTTYKPGLFEEGWLLESLRPLYEMGLITDVLGRVKGGKEANVYRVAGSPNTGHALLAAKVYRPHMFRTLKDDSAYRQGRSVLTGEGRAVKPSDHRVMRAIGKKSAFGEQVAHTSWLMHEYNTLKALYERGAAVPQPISSSPNAILMSYRGNETLAAPTLIEVALDPDQAVGAFRTVLATIRALLGIGLVHGDLSAYNVLYWDDQATVIDFPQVISIEGNPQARELLKRDLTRIVDYFSRCGLTLDTEALLEQLWTPVAPIDTSADWLED
jgi:RIO kinase 1